MGQFPFLSDEWMAETRKIRAEYQDRVPEIPVSVRMNQIIQDVPFGDGVIHAYVDTSSGQLVVEAGQLETPDLTVTLAYDTARALLVDGDAQAAMSAFLGGRIKIDGDITKLIALQTVGAQSAANPAAIEMVKRIQEMTS
jgi:putative sterol carrier protein